MGITDPDGERLLTVEETATHLGVTSRTVHRLAKKRLIAKKWLKSSRFVTLSSIRRYQELNDLTVHQLTVRLLDLEQKVAWLMTQIGDPANLARRETTLETLKKNHPELYS